MVGVGIFLILAVVAGILGFGGIANFGAGIARGFFFVFLILLVMSVLAVGFTREIRTRQSPRGH